MIFETVLQAVQYAGFTEVIKKLRVLKLSIAHFPEKCDKERRATLRRTTANLRASVHTTYPACSDQRSRCHLEACTNPNPNNSPYGAKGSAGSGYLFNPALLQPLQPPPVFTRVR